MEKKAAYLNTGTWAKKAMKEAKLFGEVVEVASSAEDNYTYIPKNFTIPADADYLHITTNNTIFGTEMRYDLDSPVPLIADMSSDIFSRPVDVSKYNCITPEHRKNVSMAGVNIVIVKDEALNKVSRQNSHNAGLHDPCEKRFHVQSPPVVPIYCAMKNLEWVKKNGGVEAMAQRAKERADMLYTEIERNQIVPWNGKGGRPFIYEYLFCDERRIQRIWKPISCSLLQNAAWWA